jgi:nitrogen-specific signal transduction histidine kinase
MDQESIQDEYFAIANRLMPSLIHQINNWMLAVRGALTLAMEEINDPEELSVYIQLGLRETGQVVGLVNQLNQMYFPHSNEEEIFDVNQLLEGTISLTRKELNQQNVNLIMELEPVYIPITAIISQLRYVFLILLLGLGDAISEAGGGDLQLLSNMMPGKVRVELNTDTPIEAITSWTPESAMTIPQDKESLSYILSMLHEIISANGGVFGVKQDKERVNFRIDLPLSSPG